MANVSFDFSYYEKIIEYIKTTNSDIDKTLNSVLENILHAQTASELVVAPNETITEIKVGKLFNVDVNNTSYTFVGTPKFNFIGNVINCSYDEITNNTVISKNNIEKYVNKQTFFVTRSNPVSKISYDSSVDTSSFSDDEIPTIGWFKEKYISADNKKLEQPVNSSSKEFVDESGVNGYIADTLTGVSIKDKKIDISITDSLVSNKFYLTSNSYTSDVDLTYIMANSESRFLSKIQSIVTDEAIRNSIINKDLSNIDWLQIKSDPSQTSSLIDVNSYYDLLGKLQLFKLNLFIEPTCVYNYTIPYDFILKKIGKIGLLLKLFNKSKDMIDFVDRILSAGVINTSSIKEIIYDVKITEVQNSNLLSNEKEFLLKKYESNPDYTYHDFINNVSDEELTVFVLFVLTGDVFTVFKTSDSFDIYIKELKEKYNDNYFLDGEVVSIQHVNFFSYLMQNPYKKFFISNDKFSYLNLNKSYMLDDDAIDFYVPIIFNGLNSLTNKDFEEVKIKVV